MDSLGIKLDSSEIKLMVSYASGFPSARLLKAAGISIAIFPVRRRQALVRGATAPK